MPEPFIDTGYFQDPYIRREPSPLESADAAAAAMNEVSDGSYSFRFTTDTYTKDEIDDKFEHLKSKIYKLLSDLNIDISEEDFYEALKL